MKIFYKVSVLFEKLFLKVKNFAIISVFGILLYRIKGLRQICKAICQYIVDWYVNFNLMTIKDAYLWLEYVLRIIIVLSLVLGCIMILIQKIWDLRLKKEWGKNRFEESIFRYLHDINTSRCFLVTGKWGSGKTYEVQNFFDKYYRYSTIKVYRISCFGLSSRNDLINEISNTIEQKDSSFYALIIKVLQFLPVIGEPIGKFFKRSYGYTSVRQGSVFIFDDFERITSRTVTNMYSKHIYRKPHISLYNDTKEFRQIKEEFGSVENAFSKVEDFVYKNSEREDLDKYIAVVGLINELIERYGMKVIIVCNTDILGEKFVYDVLISKLNCVEYKKETNPKVKSSIVNNILTNKTFDDKEKQQAITDYLSIIKDNINDIILDAKFANLRLFSALFEAFVDTAVLFDKSKLTLEFMNSLLNSILITHWAYYNNSVQWLDSFITGANIDFLMELFLKKQDYPEMVQINDCMEKVKWVDVSISGYWIFNMSVPSDDNIIVYAEKWSNYEYFELERSLLNDYRALTSATNYSLQHILFYQIKFDDDRNNVRARDRDWNCSQYITYALKLYDLSKIENVQIILDMVSQVFGASIFETFLTLLFEKLSEGHADGRIVEYTHIHKRYSRFLQEGNFLL